MMKILYGFFLVVLLFSCSNGKKQNFYDLQPVDSFLNYKLDSDVRMPLLVRHCKSDKEYLYFQNGHLSELLIYDMHQGNLIKRKAFEIEGKDAIKGGFLNGFMMVDCHHIYISGLAGCDLYETDTTGCIKRQINYAMTSEGDKLVCCFKDNGSFRFLNGKLYLPQSLNWQLGDEVLEKSSLLCCIDTASGNIKSLPVQFPELVNHIVRGTSATIAFEYKYCFDGNRFVYSFAYLDEVLVVDPITFKVEYKLAKSQYLDNLRCPSYQGSDERKLQKQLCEYPAYGRIIYDSCHKVYYRVAYVPQEIEKSVDILSLFRSGRKQFSILILDERFDVIGEHLFPTYTYNPRLCFVSEGKLYISTNNSMNPDYSDDILSFQQMELVKR